MENWIKQILDELFEQLEYRLIEAIKRLLSEAYFCDGEKEHTDEWMNLEQAARFIGVDRRTINSFETRGLKISKINNVKRINKKELERFMQKHYR